MSSHTPAYSVDRSRSLEQCRKRSSSAPSWIGMESVSRPSALHAPMAESHLVRVRVRVRVKVRVEVRVGFRVGVGVGFRVGVRVRVPWRSLTSGSARRNCSCRRRSRPCTGTCRSRTYRAARARARL
eukprot:scaffold29327_cov45-Phaeocystis_antarctica.AAC.1